MSTMLAHLKAWLRRKQGITVLLQAGGAFYAPAGHIIAFCFYRDLATGKDGGRAKKGVPIETIAAVLVPLPVTKLLNAMDDNVKRAMAAWHCEQTQDLKKQMWVDRTSFVQKLFAAA